MSTYSALDHRFKLENRLRVMVRLFIVAAMIQIFWPTLTHQLQYRPIKKALTINLNRVSPAYSAFRDLTLQTILLSAPASGVTAEPMGSGKVAELDLFSKEQSSTIVLKPLKLAPMTIKQETTIESNVESMVIAVQPNEEPIEKVDLAAMYGTDGEMLSLAQRKEVLQDHYSRQEWQPKSFSDVARQVIEDQKENALVSAPAHYKKIATSTGQHIVVARPTLPKGKKPTKKNRDQAKKDNRYGEEKTASRTSSSSDFMVLGDSENFRKMPFWIGGHILMTGGVAYLGKGDSFRIHHIIDGYEISEARVNYSNGDFEIQVQGLTGHLIGELRDETGQLMGYGEIDLRTLHVENTKETEIKNQALLVRPFLYGLRAEVVASSANVKRPHDKVKSRLWLPDLDLQVLQNDEGVYTDKNFEDGSSFVIEGRHDQHVPGVTLGVSGQGSPFKLYRNSAVQAFTDLLSGPYKKGLTSNTMIWGRVAKGNSSLKNAKVELVGTGEKPVYFAGFLPNARQETTSGNGLFVFPNAEPGAQLVRAKLNGRYYSSALTDVHPGKITYVELSEDHIRRVKLDVSYPFYNNSPETAVVTWVAQGEGVTVRKNKSEDVMVPQSKGLQIVEVSAGNEFGVYRASVHPKNKQLNFSLISGEKIMSWSSEARVNIEPNTGLVVGWVSGDEFDIHLDRGLHQQAVVLYIDELGNWSRQPLKTSMGFVIYNYPLGLQSVTVVPKSKRKLYTEAIVADSDVTNHVDISF